MASERVLMAAVTTTGTIVPLAIPQIQTPPTQAIRAALRKAFVDSVLSAALMAYGADAESNMRASRILRRGER